MFRVHCIFCDASVFIFWLVSFNRCRCYGSLDAVGVFPNIFKDPLDAKLAKRLEKFKGNANLDIHLLLSLYMFVYREMHHYHVNAGN